MNRSALKSAGFVLLGVVLGCAIGRPPWWGGGEEEGNERLHGTAVQNGVGTGAGDLPAAKAALSNPDAGGRRSADLAIVPLLIQTDIHAALAHARRMKDDVVEAYVLMAMAETDPMAAAAEFTPRGKWSLQTVQVIADRLLRSDRATFKTWMESLKDPAQQVIAFEAAFSPEFQPDAKRAALEAAVWLTGLPGIHDKAGNLSASLAQSWMEAKDQPAEVAAWATALPEGRARDSAVEQVARSWAVEDAAASSAWIATLPPDVARDRAVLGLVLTIGDESPARVFEWLPVKARSMRSKMLMNAVERWAAEDPDGFAAAVEVLPAGDRDRLRNAVEHAVREREKTEER